MGGGSFWEIFGTFLFFFLFVLRENFSLEDRPSGSSCVVCVCVCVCVV